MYKPENPAPTMTASKVALPAGGAPDFRYSVCTLPIALSSFVKFRVDALWTGLSPAPPVAHATSKRPSGPHCVPVHALSKVRSTRAEEPRQVRPIRGTER